MENEHFWTAIWTWVITFAGTVSAAAGALFHLLRRRNLHHKSIEDGMAAKYRDLLSLYERQFEAAFEENETRRRQVRDVEDALHKLRRQLADKNHELLKTRRELAACHAQLLALEARKVTTIDLETPPVEEEDEQPPNPDC